MSAHDARWRFEVKWEPRDVWVGLFWDTSRGVDLYVCLIPCVSFHLYRRGDGRKPWWATS